MEVLQSNYILWLRRKIVQLLVAANVLSGFTSVSGQQGGSGTVLSNNVLARYIDMQAPIGRGSVGVPADIDGNGVIDIVTSHSLTSDTITILLMTQQGRVGSFVSMGLGNAGGFGGQISFGDDFGRSIAGIGDLDGDGVPEIAVGAESDFDNGTKTGSVWIIFLNPDGTAKAEQKIDSSNGGFSGVLKSGDSFGSAVAGVGDLDGDGVADLAVGASGVRGGPGAAGAGWGAIWILFLNPDGTVKADQKIGPGAGGFSGHLGQNYGFGRALACIGDLDGDGIVDLASGTPGAEDPNGTHYGAVWVLFLNADGTVKSDQEISTSAGGFTGQLVSGDAFSAQVAPLGDLDHDGTLDLATSAHQDDDGGTDRGALWFLFLNADGTVKDSLKFSASSANYPEGALTQFGVSMASLGDFDDDGAVDLIAGSSLIDDQGIVSSGQWMLYLDDGEVSASFVYGSGVNPPGSLSILSGRPSVGTTVTVGLDNPLGTQGAGAGTTLVLSLGSDPNFPLGTSIPGLGMAAPGAPGELLISVQAQDLIPPGLIGGSWQGPGQPVGIGVDIPNDLNLIGLSVYAQGVLIDLAAPTGGIRFGLTDAVELRVGA